MRKILLLLFTATASLVAAPQAVVFDWGNVISFDDRSVVVDFMRATFKFSESEFEQANLEKRKAVKAGKSEIDFWLQFAKEKGIRLPEDWPHTYTSVVKASVGADPKMYALIDELKNKQIRVGLLSNINDRYVKLIRDFGFYEPFDPCLLSCEMGLEKPDQKAYETLLKTMNLPAGDIVFIDDKMENVEAAKKMGIDAFVFESLEQVQLELTKRGLVTSVGYVKETQAKKCVVGISVKTSNEHFQTEALPLRDKFLGEKLAEKISNRLDQSILCVYTDYEGDHTKPFTWLIGCEVSDLKVIPEGMVGVEIPTTSYAVFTATGPFPQSMMGAWTSIWKSDVKRAYTTDFEVYGPDFNPQKNPEVKIYIAAQ